jgi:hypothetical protein
LALYHFLKTLNHELCQIFHDNKRLCPDHILNIFLGESCLKTAFDLGRGLGIQLLLEVVRFKVGPIASVPLGAFSPVPFLLALRIATGPLAIFEPWMGRKPPAANTARPLPDVSLMNHVSPLLDGNQLIQSSPLQEDTPPITSKPQQPAGIFFQRKVEKRRMEWKENQKNDKDFFKTLFESYGELNTHSITKRTT